MTLRDSVGDCLEAVDGGPGGAWGGMGVRCSMRG